MPSSARVDVGIDPYEGFDNLLHREDFFFPVKFFVRLSIRVRPISRKAVSR